MIIISFGLGCKVECFKCVGIYLDEHLTWKHHLNYIRGKAASATFALSKVKKLLPSNIKYTIYNTLFRSFVEYGITALGKAKGAELCRISMLQKKAVRYLEMQNVILTPALYFISTKFLNWKI